MSRGKWPDPVPSDCMRNCKVSDYCWSWRYSKCLLCSSVGDDRRDGNTVVTQRERVAPIRRGLQYTLHKCFIVESEAGRHAGRLSANDSTHSRSDDVYQTRLGRRLCRCT